MVTSLDREVYVPFHHHVTAADEPFHCSEDGGSELHSPIYDEAYIPEEFPLRLGQVAPRHSDLSLYGAGWDGRFESPDVGVQVRDMQLLQGFQVPSATLGYDFSHHTSHELGLHDHSLLDLDTPGVPFQPATLTPTADYPFSLPQSRLPEPQFRVSHDALHDTQAAYQPSRSSASVPTAETSSQISLPSSATKPAAATNGNLPTSSRPARREASSVVIACRQCRARKIRCDSTRPVCHNCTRRNNECEYDAVPKRRGPDKRPGTRQRSCKKRPADAAAPPAKKKRKTVDELDAYDVKVKEMGTGLDARDHSLSLTSVHDGSAHMSHASSVSLDASDSSLDGRPGLLYGRDYSPGAHRHAFGVEYPSALAMQKPFARALDVKVHRSHPDEHNKATFIPMTPTVEYTRKTWWDDLLREHSLRDIMSDLTFLFTSSSYWLSFIHIPTFFRDLQDPELRVRMQPAFVMATLAMATLMKSSEIELGANGRTRALYFRDTAQAMLESACSQQSVDYTLAEAALILALFESSCHPHYNPERAACSLKFLDRIIQVLSLYSVDAHDPDVAMFNSRAVPAVYFPDNYRPPKKCCCVVPTHGMASPITEPSTYSPLSPPWNPNWSDAEIRKEECRRLCWVALALVSSYTFQCAAFHQEPQQFALANPANYALLFPGEAYERALGHEQLYGQSPKDSVWAVYCRCMLLWSCSLRPSDERWTADQRGRFALEMLEELRAVQGALDMHQCDVDGTLVFVCKELLYHTRLTMAMRRDVDSAAIFDRRQAEEWLYYQEQIGKSIKAAVLQVGESAGYLLSRRPFQVSWISSQVTICLALWNYDRSLVHALELAKTFLIPLDVMNALWPSPAQRHRRDELRHKLEEACASARLQPPLPAGLTLPPILRT